MYNKHRKELFFYDNFFFNLESIFFLIGKKWIQIKVMKAYYLSFFYNVYCSPKKYLISRRGIS